MTAWRYQPVFMQEGDSLTYTLCEVHLDDKQRLVAWADEPGVEPTGESLEELGGDLARMIVDVYRWKAVEFNKLTVGMTFERSISVAEMEAIAEMVESVRVSLKAKVRGQA